MPPFSPPPFRIPLVTSTETEGAGAYKNAYTAHWGLISHFQKHDTCFHWPCSPSYNPVCMLRSCSSCSNLLKAFKQVASSQKHCTHHVLPYFNVCDPTTPARLKPIVPRWGCFSQSSPTPPRQSSAKTTAFDAPLHTLAHPCSLHPLFHVPLPTS